MCSVFYSTHIFFKENCPTHWGCECTIDRKTEEFRDNEENNFLWGNGGLRWMFLCSQWCVCSASFLYKNSLLCKLTTWYHYCSLELRTDIYALVLSTGKVDVNSQRHAEPRPASRPTPVKLQPAPVPVFVTDPAPPKPPRNYSGRDEDPNGGTVDGRKSEQVR